MVTIRLINVNLEFRVRPRSRRVGIAKKLDWSDHRTTPERRFVLGHRVVFVHVRACMCARLCGHGCAHA